MAPWRGQAITRPPLSCGCPRAFPALSRGAPRCAPGAPLPCASSVRWSRRTRAAPSRPSSASSARHSPRPRSCHGGCLRTRRASPCRFARFQAPATRPGYAAGVAPGIPVTPPADRFAGRESRCAFPFSRRKKKGRLKRKSDGRKDWPPAGLLRCQARKNALRVPPSPCYSLHLTMPISPQPRANQRPALKMRHVFFRRFAPENRRFLPKTPLKPHCCRPVIERNLRRPEE